MSICIVSGTTNRRFGSDINHALYTRQHSYEYHFDGGPYASLRNTSYLKLHAIEKVLPRYEWVFWLDDDAFFTNFNKKLENFIQSLDTSIFLVMCKSPVSPSGHFVFLNAGQFFLRNCTESFSFLNAVHAVSLPLVKSWWDSNKLGLFTNGDQDAITYLVHERQLLPKVRLLPYREFNCRPYHYNRSLEEHFLVHFAGFSDKLAAVRNFALKFNLDEQTLVPRSLLDKPSLRYGQ